MYRAVMTYTGILSSSASSSQAGGWRLAVATRSEGEEKVYIMAIIDLHPFLIRISTRITVARMTPRRREMAARMSRDRGG